MNGDAGRPNAQWKRADDIAGCAIRVSGGWASRAEDFEVFAEAYLATVRRACRAA